MKRETAHLAERLAEHAEAVCKEYLSEGRRSGNYWLAGDVDNNPGRSLYVRLVGPTRGRGAAGKWTDSATGQHGDLLDLIALNRRHTRLRETLEEARAFLSEPRPPRTKRDPVPRNSAPAARRLFAASRPLSGTVAETYLRARGIAGPIDFPALRFHPRCYRRADDTGQLEARPALIAAVTDLDGNITGAHRTWLARDGAGKAPIEYPRRAMGDLMGHGVRFGAAGEALDAGEGIETVLSLKSLLPGMPMAAALSASHLGTLMLPPGLRRLYVMLDSDPAGRLAWERLAARSREANVDARRLVPHNDDWNTDLCKQGRERTLAHALAQLLPEDAERFARRQ